MKIIRIFILFDERLQQSWDEVGVKMKIVQMIFILAVLANTASFFLLNSEHHRTHDRLLVSLFKTYECDGQVDCPNGSDEEKSLCDEEDPNRVRDVIILLIANSSFLLGTCALVSRRNCGLLSPSAFSV